MRKSETKDYLLPIEVGKCVLEGQAGKVISEEPDAYVKILNDPVWNGKQWVCLAHIESRLVHGIARISVRPYREKGVKDNDAEKDSGKETTESKGGS